MATYLVPGALRRRRFGARPGECSNSALDRLFEEVWGSRWPARVATPPVKSVAASLRAADLHPSKTRSGARFLRREFVPSVDVDETEDEIRVSAELPGLDEEDFEVLIEGDVLSIRGEKGHGLDNESQGHRHLESSYGSFHRRFRLPFEVDADAVKAKYRNGLLEVAVAKPAEDEPAVRTIPVTTP